MNFDQTMEEVSNMTENVELLNYIYQNAEMGKNTVSQLVGIAENKAYKELLLSQFKEYNAIFGRADKAIKKRKTQPKKIDMFSKASTYVMITMKTIRDKSPSHISEMLIQGNTMGIIDLTKRLNEYDDADKEVLKLAKRLLELEHSNIEECKKFLS